MEKREGTERETLAIRSIRPSLAVASLSARTPREWRCTHSGTASATRRDGSSPKDTTPDPGSHSLRRTAATSSSPATGAAEDSAELRRSRGRTRGERPGKRREILARGGTVPFVRNGKHTHCILGSNQPLQLTPIRARFATGLRVGCSLQASQRESFQHAFTATIQLTSVLDRAQPQ